MTIRELQAELAEYVSKGIDPDTLVIICDTDFDPDPDVNTTFYCEERDRVCITIL